MLVSFACVASFACITCDSNQCNYMYTVALPSISPKCSVREKFGFLTQRYASLQRSQWWIQYINFCYFILQFHCKNGSTYKLQPSDNLTVHVTHVCSSAVIPHVIEPQNITGEDKIRLSFSTRLSGDYSINIRVNSLLICGSSIIRTYLPGEN